MARLAGALGRSIRIENGWIIQTCPVCAIDLKLHDMGISQKDLFKELFSFYDQHRCHAMPDEVAYQRGERAFVRASEAALALAKRGDDPVLAARAERESERLAKFVESYERREKMGA